MTRRCAWCEMDMGAYGDEPGETHGICPACMKRHFPVEAKQMEGRNGKTSDFANG